MAFKFGPRLAGLCRKKPVHLATYVGLDVSALSTSRLPIEFPHVVTSLKSPQTRTFSSSSSSPPPPPTPTSSPNSFSRLSRLEDANPERIRGIVVNPSSLGNSILPGNLIYKKYNWSGNIRKVPVELVHGYFWMIRDLKNTHQKPTLSNDRLIPAKEAQLFPPLKGLTTLADPATTVDFPSFFVAPPSQSANTTNKATLLAISFRENGFKLIPSWTEALEQHFPRDSTKSAGVQIYTLSITEQWVLYPFRNLLSRIMKQNTPNPSDQARTLVYFGTKDLDEFRDVLRMHNIMTSYVFLLDRNGCIRFAGSGEATSEDIERLVKFTKILLVEGSGGKGRDRQARDQQKNIRR